MKYLLTAALFVHMAFIAIVLLVGHADANGAAWISATILAFTSLPGIYGTWAAWKTPKDHRASTFS